MCCYSRLDDVEVENLYAVFWCDSLHYVQHYVKYADLVAVLMRGNAIRVFGGFAVWFWLVKPIMLRCCTRMVYTYNIVLRLLDVGRRYLTCMLYVHVVACMPTIICYASILC